MSTPCVHTADYWWSQPLLFAALLIPRTYGECSREKNSVRVFSERLRWANLAAYTDTSHPSGRAGRPSAADWHLPYS
jgi:hypothetical protein